MKKLSLGLFQDYEDSNLLKVMGGVISYEWVATEENGVEVDDNQISSYSSYEEARRDGCDTLSCIDARYNCATGTYY